MSWSSFQTPVPPGLSGVSEAISSGLHAVKGVVESARSASSAVTELAVGGEPPSVVALNALVSTALGAAASAVDALLDDAGVYALLVPFPKKGMVALAPPDRDAGSTFLEAPVANLLRDPGARTPEELQAMPAWQLAFDPAATFVGGNAWFLRQVAEALHDPGDGGRPQFDASSVWAYAMLVTGAEDLTAAMSGATYAARLLGLGGGAHELPPDRSAVSLVPQRVRADPSSRARTAVVTWDVVPAATLLRAFDAAIVAATHYAVIRSTDFRARAAVRVTDLFSGPLTQGATGAYGSRVMKLARYDGLTARWDDPGPLDEGRDYYYHVAFRTELRPGENDARVDQGFSELSSCAHVRLEGRRTSARSNGNPPDWVRSPSVARAVPAIGEFVDRVKERVLSVGASLDSVSTHERSFATFLDAEAQRYATRADDLTAYLSRVSATLRPFAGVHAYVGTGKGGVGPFLSDVATALDDLTDVNRPEFDGGSEYVTGVVLLAVGPDPAVVARAFAALAAFFGPPQPDSVAAAINSVNDRTNDSTTTETPVPPPVAFDAAMNPTTGPDAGCRP